MADRPPCSNVEFTWQVPEDTPLQYSHEKEPDDLSRYTDHELLVMKADTKGLTRAALTEVLNLRKALHDTSGK